MTASAAIRHHAVHRDDLTGADDDHVAGHERVDADLFHKRTAAPVRDPRRALEQETQLASGTGVGGRLQRVAAGEHEGDDHGGELLAERERTGHRQQRDRIDAHIAMRQAASDRPDERPENDESCAGPDDVCRRVGTEDMEDRAGDEPGQDDDYDRQLGREVTEARGVIEWRLGVAKVGVRGHARTMPRVRPISIRASADLQ